jgi:hypothetical protein
MIQLVYTSMARPRFTKADIEALLAVSREKNREHGITGVLLYRSGSIVQVLEGEEPAVRRLYTNILGDSRHQNAAVIYTRTIETREFPDWTMGFNCVEVEWWRERPDGFNPIFHRLEGPGASGRAEAALRAFIDKVR